MPAKGIKQHPEVVERIRKTNRHKALQRAKELRDFPRHIQVLVQNGSVHPALKSSVRSAAHVVDAYVDSLGGREDLAEGELLMIETLVRAKSVINALFERFMRSGDPAALEGISPWLLAESRALAALGLKRRAREVPSLEAYIGGRVESAAPSATGTRTIEIKPVRVDQREA